MFLIGIQYTFIGSLLTQAFLSNRKTLLYLPYRVFYQFDVGLVERVFLEKRQNTLQRKTPKPLSTYVANLQSKNQYPSEDTAFGMPVENMAADDRPIS